MLFATPIFTKLLLARQLFFFQELLYQISLRSVKRFSRLYYGTDETADGRTRPPHKVVAFYFETNTKADKFSENFQRLHLVEKTGVRAFTTSKRARGGAVG